LEKTEETEDAEAWDRDIPNESVKPEWERKLIDQRHAQKGRIPQPGG